MDIKELLIKQYRWEGGLARFMLTKLTEDLSEDELNWQPGPGHHSIWHNVWHMFLSNDYYAADALHLPAVWDEENWRDRIDLSNMERAFAFAGNIGHVPRFAIADVPDSLVDELKAPPFAEYLAYVDSLLRKVGARLKAATEEQLLEEQPWAGRTIPAYEYITGFGHLSRHIGMIEELRGLIRGPGTGTASI